MTTRSEPYTRADPPARTPGLPPLVWDFVLGLGATAYVLLALFAGMDSPVVGLLVIGVVGRRLLQPRQGRRS